MPGSIHTDRFADAVRTFCELHRSQLFRLPLRVAITSDDELSDIDLADSEEVADQVARDLAARLPGVDEAAIANRALLVIELLDGLLRLTSRLDDTRSQVLVEKFIDMALQPIRELEQT